MKIDFNYEFKEMDGTVIPADPKEEKSPPFTLKTACVNVLLNPGVGRISCPKCNAEIIKTEDLTGEEKLKRFMLATKIYNGDGLVDIGTKDIELLKKLIAAGYPQLTSGQAWLVLDPDETEGKKKE